MPVGVLILVFSLCLLPYTANYVIHHPDERHYTDGAIAMVRSGDYLSPRAADGSYRFRKPVLTYWCVAASYHLLGINALASRLPFLIAGGAVICLTYRLAKRLTNDRTTVSLATSMVMVHPVLALSATRSIPDVLLCLFLLLGATGFLGIIVLGRRSPADYWAAYVGSGLAVASKGLPALAFVVFAWAFALGNPWGRVSWRRLIHWPSVITGLVIALGWFVLMLAIHGPGALGAFWSDQVTNRVADNPWKPLYQYPLFVGVCVFSFTPWLIPLVRRSGGQRERFLPCEPRQRQAARFILLWCLIYAVIAALVTKFSTRYALPIVPLLAIYYAGMLARVDPDRLLRWIRFVLVAALICLLMLAVAAIVANVQLNTGWVEIGLVLGLVTIGVLLAAMGMRAARVPAVLYLSAMILLAAPMAFLPLRHVLLPDQGAQIASQLANFQGLGNREITMVSKPALASKVRVCSAGKVQLWQTKSPWRARLIDPSVLILSSDDLAYFEASRYQMHVVSSGVKDLSPRALVMALVRGRLPRYIQERRQSFVLAVHTPDRAGVRLARGARGAQR